MKKGMLKSYSERFDRVFLGKRRGQEFLEYLETHPSIDFKEAFCCAVAKALTLRKTLCFSFNGVKFTITPSQAQLYWHHLGDFIL